MPFTLISSEELYKRDPALKKEDIQTLRKCLEKLPHLPILTEMQLIIFLHCCNYDLNTTKDIIEKYFTTKTQYPEVLSSLGREETIRTASTISVNVLPNTTKENYGILLMKLIDEKVENFDYVNSIRFMTMVSVLNIHQHGFKNGAVTVFDMKGYHLGHLAKIPLLTVRKGLYFVQEAIPVRIRGIHVINATPFVGKLMALIRPFLNQKLYTMLHFHTTPNETLYEYVPKECLPEDYGGNAPSISELNEKTLENMLENFDFFAWHDSQKVDKNRRNEISTVSNNDVEDSFKKLEID